MENGLNKRTWISDLLCMLPACIFALSILLVRLHQFSMPMSDVYWTSLTDTSTISDLFSYWKALEILCAAGLAVIASVVGYFKDSIRFKRSFLYIPALVYMAFVLLSLALSKYKYFALRGMHEHFEGTAVLIAYVLMVFFLFNAIDSDRRVKYVIYCALGAAFLIGILGVTQATGNDFLTTAAGQKLMTPNYMLESGITSWQMIDILSVTGQSAYGYEFTAGEVYQTVYNINYVPFYLSLLVPLSAVLFIQFSVNEDKKKRAFAVVFLAFYGLYLYNFFAANSASGYFGLTAIFVAALIVFRKKLKAWIKPILCLIVVLGLVMGVLADRWLPEVKGMIGAAADTVFAKIYAETKRDFENEPASIWMPVDFVETDQDHVTFGINGSELILTRDDANSSFAISDGDGEQLYITSIEGREGVYQILDDRFHDYVTLALGKDPEGRSVVMISTQKLDWKFLYDGQFRYWNDYGKYVSMSSVPHSSLIKDYSFGSYRGRIWATTLPMLKQYLLAGAGADCFSFVFPQNDYVMLYNAFEGRQMTLITDKAHNFYMQNWVNTGLVSLLAWLALVGFYLVGAVRSFRKCGFETFSDLVNGGIFCGIIGFLFVAFFNDGSVNTMPMFYTMLGTGLAINAKDKWVKGGEETSARETQMPEI